jgi:hypothetical protein
MMKVKLVENKALGFDRPMVSYVFKYPNFPMLFDKAIIDTGCPFVIIPESTIKLRRIPYATCPKYEKTVNIGGILLELRDIGECSIKFMDVDNAFHEFKHRVFVGIPQLPIMQKLPSFLGIEFLKKFKLGICPEEDGIYLVGNSPQENGSPKA